MVLCIWLAGAVAALAQAEQMRTVSFDTSFLSIDDINSTVSVTPDIILENSPLLDVAGLQRRRAIDVVVAVSAAATAGLTAVIAANAAKDLYDGIAAKIKAKSNQNSCTITYGIDSDDGYYEGHAYEATTTGSNCDTTALEKTIKKAVYDCANKLHDAGAVRGCCQFSHGGTWTGHLRLTANPSAYPATSVNC